MSGAGLTELQGRFVQALTRGLERVGVGRKEDLFEVVAECCFQATLEALFTEHFPRGQYEVFKAWDGELQLFIAASLLHARAGEGSLLPPRANRGGETPGGLLDAGT